jgi:hypothetical protein
LVRVVAAEFDRRGWEDHEELALAIATQADRNGGLDASASSHLAGDRFLRDNRVNRGVLRSALEHVFSGRVLAPEQQVGPTYVDQSVKIGDNNMISGSINAGGNQIALTENSPPGEILGALTKFVSAGVEQGFSPSELELLDRLAAVHDIDPQRLEDAVRAGVSANPAPGRLAKFRDAVMTSAASGLAVQAIIAVVGAL